ncbi:MAG: dimethylamine monooxygenase subunit DmmA family protein [Steroidobacteraceae bacterium]
MLITGIKSKPVYAPLQADTHGRYHLMLGKGVGAAPLLRVIAEMRAAAAESLLNTQVLFVPDAGAAQTGAAQGGAGLEQFKAAAVASVQAFPETAALLEQFRHILGRSLMGTRLYVAGPESFIGLAMKIALEFNLNKDEIRAEECGTLARRVFCIHCRATTEEVRTNIVRCVGCDRWLLVRDHYSRRLAAYMGVMADAEAPGELPPLKEVFL